MHYLVYYQVHYHTLSSVLSAGLPVEILAWGLGQGSDGWHINRNKILRGRKQARNVNKRGVEWLFQPLFGQKLAEFGVGLRIFLMGGIPPTFGNPDQVHIQMHYTTLL